MIETTGVPWLVRPPAFPRAATTPPAPTRALSRPTQSPRRGCLDRAQQGATLVRQARGAVGCSPWGYSCSSFLLETLTDEVAMTRTLLLLLCALLTGCSTYGRAVSAISQPIAKAHAEADKARHAPPPPQEKPPCTPLTALSVAVLLALLLVPGRPVPAQVLVYDALNHEAESGSRPPGVSWRRPERTEPAT